VGYLYIITNPNFPGWVKVGTTNNFKARLQGYQTSSPFRDYKVEFLLEHPDYLQAEKRIQDSMKMFCKDRKKEWFLVDFSVARARIEEDLNEFLHPEDDPVKQIIRKSLQNCKKQL
jgi:hypothetical protein